MGKATQRLTTFLCQVAVLFLSGIQLTFGVRCRVCSSNLPSNTPENAKAAAKLLLVARYNLPEVWEACRDAHDPNFESIPTEMCAAEDRCAKLRVSYEDLSFVIRGCESELFAKEDVAQAARSGRVPCSADSSPSYCVCTSDLCNTAHRPSAFILKLTLLLSFFHFMR